MTFAETPADVDFFNAGSYRRYVFLAGFNTRQNVLLAAYGAKKVPEQTDFSSPRFGVTGQNIVVQEGLVGQFMDSSSAHWLSIYNTRTRKRVFDSRQFIQNLPPGKLREFLLNSLLEVPALSPDGNDLLGLASPDDGDSVGGVEMKNGVVSPTQIVHLDLRQKTAEYLPSVGLEFVWHPTQKKVVFVGPASPTNPSRNLFALDVNTKIITRLTDNSKDDFSPQWSLDGKQLFWIRGSVDATKSSNNQIFRANADGSNATAILPQIKGVRRIQLLPKIANWSRYRKLSIEPLAGKDK